MSTTANFKVEHADTFRRNRHPDLGADFVLANSKHSSTLATLRDTQLLKLLSGNFDLNKRANCHAKKY